MGNTTLKALALVMILLAVGLAIFALQLGRGQRADERAQQMQHYAVFAVSQIEPGERVEPSDVRLSGTAMEPEKGFTRVEEVVGRLATSTITVGEPVLQRHFEQVGPIARALEAGQRAVAIKVDAVVGLGGFAQAGDLVDVLFMLKSDSREVEESTARVLLHGVRVLAFGTSTEGGEGKAETTAKTAVLAVPIGDAPTLFLAESTGKLRLALRGVADREPPAQGGAAVALAGGPHAVSLDDLLQGGGGGVPAKAAPEAARPRIEIYRGLKREGERRGG